MTEQARRTAEDLVILGLVLLILFMAGLLLALWAGEASDPFPHVITVFSGFENPRRF